MLILQRGRKSALVARPRLPIWANSNPMLHALAGLLHLNLSTLA